MSIHPRITSMFQARACGDERQVFDGSLIRTGRRCSGNALRLAELRHRLRETRPCQVGGVAGGVTVCRQRLAQVAAAEGHQVD
jgi:hypothetical protein